MAQKFCQACGTAMNDSEMFCPNCGAKTEVASEVNPAQQTAVPQYVPNADGSIAPKATSSRGAKIAGKKNLIIIAAAALVVIIVGIVVLMQVTKYQKIDPQDLVKVEFSGINGQGTATVGFNIDTSDYDYDKGEIVEVEGSDYLCDDKDRLLSAYTKASSKSEAKDMRDAILDTNSKDEFTMEFELSDDKKLSNGDTVTVSIDCDEDLLKEAGIKLTDTEFEVTVEDLVEAESVDVFSMVDVTYSGYSGNGEADCETKDIPDGLDSELSFSVSPSYDLSNGDTVTVSCYVYISAVDGTDSVIEVDGKYYDLGGDVSSLTKDFTVEGLTELNELDIASSGVVVMFDMESDGKYTIDSVNDDAMDEAIADELYFNYDYSTEYAIGDKVTIKVYAYSGLADAGYKLAGTPDDDGYYQYTFTLTSDMVPAYVTDVADAKELGETIEGYYTEALNSKLENSVGWSSFAYTSLDGKIKSYETPELVKSYLRVADKISSDSYDDNVSLVRIYKTTFHLEDADDRPIYIVLYFHNLMKQGDTVYMTSTYGSYNATTSMDDITSDILNADGYSSKEIK